MKPQAALLQIQVGKRLGIAMFFAGLFSLMVSMAFYLFQVERLTARQLAELSHHLGQIVNSANLAGRQGGSGGRGVWSSDGAGALLLISDKDAGKPRIRLDNAWLSGRAPVGTNLFIYWQKQVHALSLGEVGQGQALALDPAYAGRLPLRGQLFVQVPLRWGDDPQSPWLVAQQPLGLPFSPGEVAASGLLLWAVLAVFIWLTVGIWLNKALDQVQYLAYHDHLTGLINRAALRIGLNHMLAESRRSGKLLAVLYLDLDRFKQINDSFGHAGGDLVLQECARRLSGCVRDSDFVARLGGDEFVLVVGDLSQASRATNIAQKIIDSLAQPILYGERSLQTGASVGVAVFSGNSTDPECMITRADHAMYVAKQSGRGRFHLDDTTQEKGIAPEFTGALLAGCD